MDNSYIIDPALRDLDYKALFSVAEYLERQAEIITAYARRKKSKEDEQDTINRRVEYLKETPKTVMRLLRRGYSLAEAQKEAAKICDTQVTTIQTHWDRFLNERDRKSMKKRNQLIKDLMSVGHTNVAIADILGLHPGSVCRIIAKEREKIRNAGL